LSTENAFKEQEKDKSKKKLRKTSLKDSFSTWKKSVGWLLVML
jgi:hypothetical protein